MADKEHLSPDLIVVALKEAQGLAAVAAESLGCSVQTIYNYRKRYKVVREAMEHQKERRKDVAEGKLWQRINDGDITAIIFYLKCQARDRGYIDRQEVTGPNGGPVTVRVVYADGMSG